MLVSVITINLNNVDGLQRTIESVLMQTCQDFEWIVIDGASSDGSVAVLDHYREYITCLISEPDNGVYQAMNKGVRHAQGEYLLFLNSGDRFADNSVLECFCALQDGSNFCVGRIRWEGESDPLLENASSPDDDVFRLCVSAYPHQATFIRTDTFQKYGLYREDKLLASDWYLTISAIIKGSATVAHLPILVSVCEKGGISSRMHKELFLERNDLLQENPYFAVLFKFYAENRDLVLALKNNPLVFFLFRLYYYFYRRRAKAR